MIFNTSLSPTQVMDIFTNTSRRFVVSGNMTFQNNDLSGVGDENTVNVTIQEYKNFFGSNISVSAGDSYVVMDDNGFASGITFTGSPLNVNITFNFTSGSNNFYTPYMIGNLTLDSWTAPVVSTQTNTTQGLAQQLNSDSAQSDKGDFSRDNTQGITLTALIQRTRKAFGTITQPFILTSVVDRTAFLFRQLTQPLTITALTDIDAPIRVLIIQFLTLGDDTVRILFHTQEVDQPLIITPLTDRIRTAFGEITQPITIDSVVDRTVDFIRNVAQRLLINPLTQIITIGQTLINIIQQLILNPLTDPSAGFDRDVDQPLTITPLSDRIRTTFGEIIQSFTLTSVVDRTVSFIRNIFQRLLLNPVTQVATAGQTLINIIQQLILNPLTDTTAVFGRSVDQPLIIDPLADRIRAVFSEVTQPLNIQALVDRTASFIRNVDQRLLLNPLTQIGTTVKTLINIIQQLTLSPLTDTTAAFDRGLTQPFTLDSVVDRTRDIFASITQSLSLNSIADTFTRLIRNIVQRLLIFGGLVSGIDDIVPTIMIVFPEDNTLHEGIVIDFLLNVSEPIDNWIYTFDQGTTNNTPLIFNDTSLRIVFGNTSTYNVSVYGFDEAGNSDNDQVIISLIRRLTTAFIMYLFLILLAICCLIFGHRMDRPILITTSGILFIVVGLGFGVSGILDIQNDFINRVAAYTIAGIGVYLVVAEPLEQYLRREKE